jgi:hypothetical protein
MEVRAFKPDGPVEGDDGERDDDVLHRRVEEEGGPDVTIESDPKGTTKKAPNFQDGDAVVRDKVTNVIRKTATEKAREPKWGRSAQQL